MLAHPAAALDLFAMDLARPLGRVGRGAHLAQGPGEVDRRRPRRGEHALGLGEILTAGSGQRVAVGRGDPDRGRAPHGQRPDRLGDLGGRAALELDLLVRQAPLVEEDRAVPLEPRDLLRL